MRSINVPLTYLLTGRHPHPPAVYHYVNVNTWKRHKSRVIVKVRVRITGMFLCLTVVAAGEEEERGGG